MCDNITITDIENIFPAKKKKQRTLSIRLNYGTADLDKFFRTRFTRLKRRSHTFVKKRKTMNKTFTFFSFNFRTSKIERVSRAGQNNDQQKSGCIRL